MKFILIQNTIVPVADIVTILYKKSKQYYGKIEEQPYIEVIRTKEKHFFVFNNDEDAEKELMNLYKELNK